MTTFTWSVKTLERHTATGIVSTVFFVVKAADDVYSVSGEDSITLPAPADGEQVVPYSQLTEELVIDWVKTALGGEERIAQIHAGLQAHLNEQRSPSKAVGKPW